MMTDVLRDIYYNPNHPAAFSTSTKLYRAARLQQPNLRLEDVKQWLASQLTYTLHKPVRRKFKRNPIVVDRVDEQWQGDLVDVKEFARQNDGHKYILTAIDLFSRYAFAIPIKDKQGNTVLAGIKKILKDRQPAKFQTDQGKEFVNQSVQRFLKNQGIHFFTSLNQDIKCAVVERFNRTLRNRMFKYFTANGTRRYIDILPQLIEAYNRTIHRSVGMRPIDVTEAREKEVFQKLHGVSSFRSLLKRNVSSQKIPVGSQVRIPYKSEAFQRGYYPQWTDESFIVTDKITGRKRPTYKLKDQLGTKIKRKIYPEQIQKIDTNIYRIEKVLKRKKINNVLHYYVKWQGYPSSSNQWVPASSVVNMRDA